MEEVTNEDIKGVDEPKQKDESKQQIVKDEPRSLQISTPNPHLTTESQELANLVIDISNYEKLAPYYVKSGLAKVKTEADFIVGALAGRELGLNITQSVNNIININGTATLQNSIVKGLLLKHNILFKIVDDLVPLYNYYETDDKGVLLKDDNKPILIGTFRKEDAPKNSKEGKKPTDFISTYEFTRYFIINGETEKHTITYSYRWSDAVTAGLAEKDNYVRMPRAMINARAFSGGAREIAGDILNGLYTTVEVIEHEDSNVRYTVDPDTQDVDYEVVED